MTWQPIDSAPSGPILVATESWIAVSRGKTSDGRWWTTHPPIVGSRPHDYHGHAEAPTHWMPLPDPPIQSMREAAK